MKIEFLNLKKIKVPFLIDLTTDNYFSDLSKNSKRHYNKAYRLWKNNTNVRFYNEFQNELYNLDVMNHFELNVHKLIELSNLKNVFYLKITDKHDNLIAFNIYYVTNQFKYVYSSCPYIKWDKYSFNNFVWFETINFFLKSENEVLDIEYDYDIKITNNKLYEFDKIYSFQNVLNSRIKLNGFDKQNNSKFLFLTTNEKKKTDMYYLMGVCLCGQKNLISFINNCECVSCKSQLIKKYD